MSFYSYTPGAQYIRKWFAKGDLLYVLLEDKHQNQEAILASEKGFADFCLRVLKDRMKSGAYYSNPNLPENQPEKPSLTPEQAAALPEGKVKKMAMLEIDNYIQGIKNWEHQKSFWDDANKAIKNKDGWLAYECLMGRAQYQYEGIRISNPEVCK